MSTRELAAFLAQLHYEDLPPAAVERTKELFIDWMGSALAGRNARPVRSLERFCQTMGPEGGAAEILVSRRTTSPLFAALVNAAASHVVEQDDLHNASVMHPGTVVFPAALAVAQAEGRSGRDLITACVAGYEAGCRVGEFLGRSHYKLFHTTGTAGTLGAAAAVAKLLKADDKEMLHAFGSAGTQAAGLWEFLRDAADSKQLHAAKAAADGLLAAYLARDRFTGATRILEGSQGMGAGLSRDADNTRLTERLGKKWAVCDTSLKFHASCRHTHPAADALLEIIRRHNLDYRTITRIRARVYQAAQDVLGAVASPETVHQSKFCMGFVLALIARNGSASIDDFNEAALRDPELLALCRKTETVVDPAIDAAYPQRWSAIVEVETSDAGHLEAFTEIPKGDPGNRLTRAEIAEKALRLATYQDAASAEEMREVMVLAWRFDQVACIGRILPDRIRTVPHATPVSHT
jgi:2-methylcitrate dehydratase PrpD